MQESSDCSRIKIKGVAVDEAAEELVFYVRFMVCYRKMAGGRPPKARARWAIQ